MPTAAAPTTRARVPLAGTRPAPPTNDQLVSSCVTIHLDPLHHRLGVAPDPVQLYYLHDRGRGCEMRPHRILWGLDFALLPGEKVVVRIDHVTHPSKITTSSGVFSGSFRPKSPRLPGTTWEIAYGGNATLTEDFRLENDNFGRIDFKYEVELVSPTRTIPVLDPGGNLIPDP